MLWANYGTRVGNTQLHKKKKPLISLPWATFWGVFPDLFAFALPFIFLIPKLLHGQFPASHHSDSLLAAHLYQYSHSLVIWVAVFTIAWIISKHPRLELLGWVLHILIDIPSHLATFYPTPFLFPLSNYRFLHGVSWGNKWYMIINYSLLLIVSLYLFRKKRKIT